MDENRVRNKIRDDKLCSIVFESNPDAVLVGGFIRDIILKTPSQDRDFLVTEPPDRVAQIIHRIIGGKIVRFKKGMLCRIVTPEGGTIDFTMVNKDIEEDLLSRDLTINSIGYRQGGGLIDPANGIGDIEKRLIRTYKKENLLSDPVRIIRAYRFASQIEGVIEKKTRGWLKELKDLMVYSPKERLTTEFIKILSGSNYMDTLLKMSKDKILEVLLSCNNKMIDDILEKILKVKGTFKVIPNVFKMQISGELLDFERLTVLEGVMVYANHGKILLVLPYKLRRRVKRLKKSLDGGFDINKKNELFHGLMTAWPAVYEYIILSGRGDLIGEAKRFSRLMRHSTINGKTIKLLRPELKGKEIKKAIEKTQEEVFCGKLKGRDHIRDFIRNIAIKI